LNASPIKLIAPTRLPDRAGLTPERLAAESAYAVTDQNWVEAKKNMEELRANITADAETVSFDELCERQDTVRSGELRLAQAAVILSRDYVGHVEKRLPELKAAQAQAAADLEKTEKAVAKKLNAAGVSIETQPAWPHNAAAAAITFGHRVHESTDWRAAKAAAVEAAGNVNATVDEIRHGKERIVEAVAVLQAIADRIAGVPGPSNNRLPVMAA